MSQSCLSSLLTSFYHHSSPFTGLGNDGENCKKRDRERAPRCPSASSSLWASCTCDRVCKLLYRRHHHHQYQHRQIHSYVSTSRVLHPGVFTFSHPSSLVSSSSSLQQDPATQQQSMGHLWLACLHPTMSSCCKWTEKTTSFALDGSKGMNWESRGVSSSGPLVQSFAPSCAPETMACEASIWFDLWCAAVCTLVACFALALR